MTAGRKQVRRRFWIESVLAGVTGVLFVVTLFWRDWLEAFGFDPDHGNGTVEWLIVAGLAVISLVFAAAARIERRAAAPATG